MDVIANMEIKIFTLHIAVLDSFIFENHCAERDFVLLPPSSILGIREIRVTYLISCVFFRFNVAPSTRVEQFFILRMCT